MKIAIDSSVLLSIFLQDSNFEKANKLIKEYANKATEIVIPNIVIFETMNSVTKNQIGKDKLENLYVVSQISGTPMKKKGA